VTTVDRSELAIIGCYGGALGRGEGILVTRIEGTELAPLSPAYPVESPSFLVWHPTLPVVYAVSETQEGEVVSLGIDGDGGLHETGRSATGGVYPCHLAVDWRRGALVAANYESGTVSVHHLAADGAVGERTHEVRHTRGGPHPRQRSAHPHHVHVVADGVLVVDLGGDAIYRYGLDPDLRLVPTADPVAFPPGTGPRHVVINGSRWYVSGELSASVLALSPTGQLLGDAPATSRDDPPTLPSEIALSADGRFVYLANRGPDTVSVFTVDGLTPVGEVPTGRWPRHIALAGGLLYVANEQSHEVTTMSIDPGSGRPEPVATLATPSPTCVLVAP
jgi:6-phosphogluconolactonase